MKVSVGPNMEIVLEEVYSGILLKTNSDEEMGICMRDSGFEFSYQGKWYEAKEGTVRLMGTRCYSPPPNAWHTDPSD